MQNGTLSIYAKSSKTFFCANSLGENIPLLTKAIKGGKNQMKGISDLLDDPQGSWHFLLSVNLIWKAKEKCEKNYRFLRMWRH